MCVAQQKMTFTRALLIFMTCVTLLSTTEVFAARLPVAQLRCQCLKTYSGKPIHPKIIQSFQKIPAGPHCKREEIIATLRTGRTCLNPKDEWVKKIMKR